MTAVGKVLGCCLLLVGSFVLHADALHAWWWNDDATILMHAISHPAASYFYRPEHWRDLVVTSFTPWLSATFAIDQALSPWNPAFHYGHHLLSIGLCAVLLTVWLWQRCRPLLSLSIGALFLWAAPVSLVALQLMSRHYIEGLLFLFVHYLCIDQAQKLAVQKEQVSRSRDQTQDANSKPYQKRLNVWRFAAGFFALLAMCSKEVYIPLSLLSILWLDNRMRYLLVPTVAAIVFFLGWRSWMLGDWLGGYVGSSADQVRQNFFEGLRHGLDQLAIIPARIFDPLWPLALLAAGLLLLHWQIRSRSLDRSIQEPGQSEVTKFALIDKPLARDLAAIGIALILVIGPLWPLTKVSSFAISDQRFFIAGWAVFLMGLGLAFKRHSGLGIAVCCCLAFLCTKPRVAALESQAPLAQEYWVQGKAIATAPEGSIIFLTPRVANWYADSVLQMRRLQSASEPFLMSDWLQSLQFSGDPMQVLRFDPSAAQATSSAFAGFGAFSNRALGQMLDIPIERFRLEKQAWLQAVERGQGMNFDALLRYNHEQQVLSWAFKARDEAGAIKEAQFVAVLFEGGVFALPPTGQLRTNDLTKGCLVLKLQYKNDRGDDAIAYSGVMRFDGRQDAMSPSRESIAVYQGTSIAYQTPPDCSNRKQSNRP